MTACDFVLNHFRNLIYISRESPVEVLGLIVFFEYSFQAGLFLFHYDQEAEITILPMALVEGLDQLV